MHIHFSQIGNFLLGQNLPLKAKLVGMFSTVCVTRLSSIKAETNL